MKRSPTLQSLAEDFAASGAHSASIEDVRCYMSDRLGYYVSGPAAGRAMSAIGWERFTWRGKVHFNRPAAAA